MLTDARELVDRLDDLEAAIESGEGDDLSLMRSDADRLRELIAYIEGYSGERARDGIALIRDRDFVEYAQEYADEIGAVDRDAGWPQAFIDWKAAADELKQDYTSVEIDGEDYWFR